MTDERIHRAVSADGTELAGRVWGRGPALVLVHGGIGDGDVAWEALLPHLTDRFTCYLPSTRGRGLSSDNPDHSPARLGSWRAQDGSPASRLLLALSRRQGPARRRASRAVSRRRRTTPSRALRARPPRRG